MENVRCEGHHSRAQGEQDSNPRELQIIGGRNGLFVEWADYIESGGGSLEEQRLECRELLGEMAKNEQDLDGAKLKHYRDLTTIAWWEHDETEDAERELRTLRDGDGARRLFLHLLHKQSTAPPSASDGSRDPRGGSEDVWLGQPHPPCTKSDPTWGAEGWRWGQEVGGENGRPPHHRVDGALWRRRFQGCRWTEHAHVGANSGPIVSFRVSAYAA